MSKLILALLFVLSLLYAPFAFAEEFALTKIGALNVDGKYFNHWWYEPTRLTLEGTGSRGANIDIYVDDAVKTIKASAEDGKWKYSHETELEKKDHNITVASGDRKIAFVLTVGAASVPEDQMAKATDILPETGAFLPILGLVGVAGTLIYFGFRKENA